MADTLATEAFDLAWYARASDTAAQVARMAAHHAAGSDALAQRVRARQDLAARLVVQEANLLKEIGRPAGQADAARTAKRCEAEAKTRSELEALDAALERDFPRYGELTSPRPLMLAVAQRLVGPNEALLAFLFSGDEGYVWALHRDQARMARLGVSAKALSDRIRQLRVQLDLSASEADDGLLTASEISLLKMNADWVVLSACNAAASDATPGAEGLSGLAKAFFYAGARSLLVSHWAVDSDATVALSTRMFAEAAKGTAKERRCAVRCWR